MDDKALRKRCEKLVPWARFFVAEGFPGHAVGCIIVSHAMVSASSGAAGVSVSGDGACRRHAAGEASGSGCGNGASESRICLESGCGRGKTAQVAPKGCPCGAAARSRRPSRLARVLQEWPEACFRDDRQRSAEASGEKDRG